MKNKKGWIIGLGLIVALGGTSAVVAAEAASTYISKDKAKQIALKAAPGSVTDIELEHGRNAVYYEVDIDRKDTFQEVDVHVEAVSGKVLSIRNDDDDHTPRVTAAPAANAAANTAATSEATASSSTVDTNATSASTATKPITKEQAGKLAQQKVKGDIIRVESDWDDGIKKFEVKLKTAAGIAEVDIAAASGKVLDVDYDDDRYDDDDDHDDKDDKDDQDDQDDQDDEDYDDDDRD